MPRLVDDSKMWDKFVKTASTKDEAYKKSVIEAYKQGRITKEELIQEGLWDRVKARGAGALGSFKDVGKRIKGAAQGVKAGFTGQQGPAPQQFTSGLDAKAMSIINSHVNKIERELIDTTRDLEKLGLTDSELQKKSPDVASAVNTLKSTVNNLKSRLQPGGQVGKAAVKVGDYKNIATDDKGNPIERGKLSSLVPFRSGFDTRQTTTKKGTPPPNQ